MADRTIFGIDLGTTYSCIAYVDEYGQPTVITNEENEPTTPSVVFFESQDNVVIGKYAKEVASLHEDQVVSAIKREMGSTDWRRSFFGTEYSPVSVSALILKRLMEIAEVSTSREVVDAVITVPAYFGAAERGATKQAGEMVNLKVHYIISEPTAAAIAYGVDQEEDKTILVYDLGGGTFDTTVISLRDQQIEMICTGGNHTLGGRDWDEALARHLAAFFADEKGENIDALLENPETWQDLLNQAEEIKRALTNREEARKRINHEGGSAMVTVTRETFGDVTNDLLERTVELTNATLEEAKKKGFESIDELLLVGGSSFMPQVRDRLEREYSIPIKLFDPNQSVAKGAALFGYKCELDRSLLEKLGVSPDDEGVDAQAVLDGADTAALEAAKHEVAQETGRGIAVIEKALNVRIAGSVSPKSFGLVIVEVDPDDPQRKHVKNLILTNQRVPAEITRDFGTAGDQQQQILLECVETSNNDEEPFEFDQDQKIGEAVLEFTRALPASSPIRVTFNLTEDGLLKVFGEDLTTGQEIRAEFNTTAMASPEEFEEQRAQLSGVKVSS